MKRKSKFTIIRKVASKQATEVTNALIEMLYSIKPIIKTIISNNDKEFANHKEIAKALDSEFYFAHLYHSWERGDLMNILMLNTPISTKEN